MFSIFHLFFGKFLNYFYAGIFRLPYPFAVKLGRFEPSRSPPNFFLRLLDTTASPFFDSYNIQSFKTQVHTFLVIYGSVKTYSFCIEKHGAFFPPFICIKKFIILLNKTIKILGINYFDYKAKLTPANFKRR